MPPIEPLKIHCGVWFCGVHLCRKWQAHLDKSVPLQQLNSGLSEALLFCLTWLNTISAPVTICNFFKACFPKPAPKITQIPINESTYTYCRSQNPRPPLSEACIMQISRQCPRTNSKHPPKTPPSKIPTLPLKVLKKSHTKLSDSELRIARPVKAD